MDKKTLQEWIRTGREIEFEVNGVNYSLTNFMEGNEVYLSFCEFSKKPWTSKTSTPFGTPPTRG